MILGVDASNIVDGGGITHLAEMLRGADPTAHGFSSVIVWGRGSTLDLLEGRPWLVKARHSSLEGTLFARLWWQRSQLSKLAKEAGCDVLFVPGGLFAGSFHPTVSMSQNMLPFDWPELRRFGWSPTGVRLRLLRLVQARTFRRAEGVIFLTEYARKEVTRVMDTTLDRTTIVPHGINTRFACRPREQQPMDRYTMERPLRVLYVSIISLYKHQWRVAEAVAGLRRMGVPVVLELVGPAYPPALRKLRETLKRIDPAGEAVRYSGEIAHEELSRRYAEADIYVFASSCENMPNILIEGMASGLPIACSSRGPMPEVLGDAGVYFDPEDASDIGRALMKLIESPDLRARLAQAAFGRAQAYSWRRCANETFAFLGELGDPTNAASRQAANRSTS